jgi:hypothetical protein
LRLKRSPFIEITNRGVIDSQTYALSIAEPLPQNRMILPQIAATFTKK